jgi:uncharacterized protein (TIGR02186 family)
MRALLALLLLICLAGPAAAERLVAQMSRSDVSITSSFSGETLTLFGTIEPSAGNPDEVVKGPYHIIITVTGPLQKRVAHRMTNNFGIWINTEQVVFDTFPSFYQVLSDARLKDITDPVTLATRSIPLEYQTSRPESANWWDSTVFGNELVRLMQKSGQFKLSEQGVVFRSDTFYFGQVTLPSDTPPGPYLAHTYLFKNGSVVAEHTDGFSVRKIGFERFVGQAARSQPLLYGLVAVILALSIGWLGGVVFKR